MEKQPTPTNGETDLRAFFDSIQDMVVMGTPDGRVLYANAAMTTKLGYGFDEIAALGILGLHPAEKQTEATEIFAAMFRGERDSCPLPLLTKNGTRIPVETRVSFGTWDGQPCVFGVSKDLSAENAALQRQSGLITSLLDSILDLVFYTDADGVYLGCNPQFAAFVGRDRDDIVGKTDYDLFDRDVAESFRENDRAMLAQGSARQNDEWITYPDGRRVLIDTLKTPYRDAGGAVIGVLGISRDITERKRAEEEQKAILETTRDGFFVADSTARFLNVNAAYCAMVGYTRDELLTMSIADVEAQENPAEVALHIEKLRRDGFDLFQTKHRRKDGDVLDMEVSVSLMLDYGGKMVVFVRDITENKKAEDELRRAKEQAVAASKAKSEFLANMSHEIRTPLNGVIGFTDLLKGTPLSAVQKQYVDNANVSGHTLLGIINDILDFSKIEAGMLHLEMIKSDMVELLENSADIVKYTAAHKKLELLVHIDPTMPRFAVTDPVRLKQILANLLGNAVKFTETGEVELRVAHEPLGDGNSKLTFFVRDTGIGITAEQQQKLFKAFSQADSSTTRKFGGTGLGLIISESIAKKLGSEIRFTSTHGEGTTFYFAIVTATEDGEQLGQGPIDRVKRCLIIDDNANNRLILEQMLTTWQIAHESCDNGLSALAMLDTAGPFDVVICDYNMPGIDGIDTIRLIREKLKLDPERQPIVLLHSSAENAELQARCEELGVRFRLTKPVKSGDLRAYLSRVHEPHGMTPAPPETGGMPTEAATALDFATGTTSGRFTILVAEDVAINMMMIKALLRKTLPGVHLEEAANGRQAIEHFAATAPDLVFMDVQMPDVDGLTATRTIRAIERERGTRTPIVALTAGAFKEEQEKCLAAGMDDFVSKPVDPDRIRTVLSRFLQAANTDRK